MCKIRYEGKERGKRMPFYKTQELSETFNFD